MAPPYPSSLIMTAAENREVRLSLGPMQIGNFLNSLLLGVLIIQAGQYFQNFRDPIWIRGLVILTLIIDIAQSALMMYMTWEYTVTHFADFEFLGHSIWALSSIPFFSVPVSWIVQGFFAWRIHIITKTKRWSILVGLFAVIQGSFGIYAGIGSFMANSTADNVQLQKFAIVWFIFAMLCDVTIMIVMIWSLSQAKTGFKDTDTLITKINRSVIETGAATSITVLIDCLFLFLIPGTDMHLIPVMAVGKVYSNSFLYLLNSRGTYRKVSSLRTADFARSLDRSNGAEGTNGHGTVRVYRPTGGVGTGPRGLGALKFAPNEDLTTRGTVPIGVDSEPGVYVTHDTFVMRNFTSEDVDTHERHGAGKDDEDAADAASYVIDTKHVAADETDDGNHKRDFL